MHPMPIPSYGVSRSFLGMLSNLRWLSVVAQAITVLVVTGPMQVALPQPPLWLGIGLLATFNVYASWRARQPQDTSPAEAFMHLLVDIVVLAWLVAWSGGIENPFSSLFLIPIALSMLVLPPAWVWTSVAASAAGYAASALLGHELPHIHGALGDTFNVHKLGMLVNFFVSAAVLLGFFSRMAVAWRQREREIAVLREQFARNEGILALATHAASVAHELNTPLGTLTLMVNELIEEGGTAQQREDFASMKALLDLCRDRVKELAAPAEPNAPGGIPRTVDLERVIERWQLVRPAIELRRTGSIAGHEQVAPAVGHLLQALLNNAADASEQNAMRMVDLRLDADDGGLTGEIGDYGRGFDTMDPVLPGTLFRTSKSGGMGIGLALSHATVERLGGQLSMQARAKGEGVRVLFRLPATAVA
jgi:two-component system, sensor histidine kinase RegB